MDTILFNISHVFRKLTNLFSEYHDNPLLWLGCFLAGLFIFKIVWDALRKEK